MESVEVFRTLYPVSSVYRGSAKASYVTGGASWASRATLFKTKEPGFGSFEPHPCSTSLWHHIVRCCSPCYSQVHSGSLGTQKSSRPADTAQERLHSIYRFSLLCSVQHSNNELPATLGLWEARRKWYVLVPSKHFQAACLTRTAATCESM